MTSFRTSVRVVSGGRDQDRVAIRTHETTSYIILADGAGGISGGRRAAELVIEQARPIHSTLDAVQELFRLDACLQHDPHAGESTAVLLAIHAQTLFGASVGDSGAWLLADELVDLTAQQRRRPLLGSGLAQPVSFGPIDFTARVLVASDGLFKFAPHNTLQTLARHLEIEHATTSLVNAVRLPSGTFQDDLAVVLIE